MTDWKRQGALDCYQDRCENTPFGSIGGLDKRSNMQRPRWVPASDWAVYQDGYEEAAEELFGDDWTTCEFGWQKAITIEGKE